jgi:chitooligosaccharide deacetylase
MLSLFTILRRSPRKVGLNRGEVVLTFDDGPNATDNVTERLLDVLQQHNVPAAFCVVGRQVRQFPATVRRMHRQGHLIVNHTFTHTHPLRLSTAALHSEVSRCDEAIGQALSIRRYKSEYCRVPYGIVTIPVRRIRRQLDLKPVLLTHYGWDTRVGPQNCDGVVDGLIDRAVQQHGGMFVLHDGICGPEPDDDVAWDESCRNRSWVPAAVDRIIRELHAAGLHFVLPGTSPQTVAFPSQTGDTNSLRRAA